MSQSAPIESEHLRGHIDRVELTERLVRLVTTESENPPGREAAAAELVAAMCEDLGLDVAMQAAVEGRPNVIASWRGGDGPTLGFCSHIDVVPAGDPALWEVDPYGAQIIDNRLYGRGSSDAKGPIAAALEGVAILKRAGFEPRGVLELELVSDEETMGFRGAGWLVEHGHIAPDLAIVGEPTGLRVVVAQRGACWYRLITRGRAAHGSAPERGVNAIAHMAEVVSHLTETLPDIEHPVVGGPSINVGTIAGGEKTNIVPASCVIEIDRRSIPGETETSVTASINEAIERARSRYPNLDAHLELEFYSRPFEVGASSRVVPEMRAAVASATGRDAETIGFRGASDARFLAEAGVDVLVCGPGDIALAHTARESIDLDELAAGALAYADAFARLLS